MVKKKNKQIQNILRQESSKSFKVTMIYLYFKSLLIKEWTEQYEIRRIIRFVGVAWVSFEHSLAKTEQILRLLYVLFVNTED